jgi:hypothetical protein
MFELKPRNLDHELRGTMTILVAAASKIVDARAKERAGTTL